MNKMDMLIEHLKSLKSVAIAFSGGVDSTFLAFAAAKALGVDALAITIDTPYMPRWEIEEAKVLANSIGIKHMIISSEIPSQILDNPENRCYLCKKQLFSKIVKEAEKLGIEKILDGSNLDDTKDYRPGMKALDELKVHSPLLELSWTKQMIRDESQNNGLDTHDKPAYACLLTRLEHNVPVTLKALERVEKAEKAMHELGFKAVRVRSHGDLARIELSKENIDKLIGSIMMETISTKVKQAGFRYACLDLSGYKMGSMNEKGGIKDEER